MTNLQSLKLAVAISVLTLSLGACTMGTSGGQGKPGQQGGTQSSIPPVTPPSPPGGQSGAPSQSDQGKKAQKKDRDSAAESDSASGQGESGDNQNSDRNDNEDIRVASADQSRAGSNTAAGTETDMEGSPDGNPDVTAAEALEGANAAVDAAAGAVNSAEAAIARARDMETDASGSGNSEDESFDPWQEPGGGAEGAATDAGADSSDGDSGEAGAAATTEQDTDNESFDPFASYGDDDKSERELNSVSLDTADSAVNAARAALNRARRALITAAGADTGDADAEAVQMAAAQAAMQAAAEAVIASAIAVVAASDAMDTGDSDPAAAERAEESLSAGIATVVGVMQRDMSNAGEALEATGELLAAAGTLMGMLGNVEQQQEKQSEQNAEERVASLESDLDRSLEVFDGQMQAEGNTIARSSSGEDSELQTLGVGLPDPRDTTIGTGGSIERPDVKWNKPRHTAPSNTTADPEEKIYSDNQEARAQDDDIVARQLREAAMAETDPELRAALWQEYNNYKESLESGEAEAN